MLNKDYLLKLAGKNQTTPDNIFREYAQNVFLSFLYQKKDGRKMLFKGGTALKIVYQSPRFSEDLDFTLEEITFPQIEKTVLSVLGDLEKENFQPQIVESKETSGGYLAELAVSVHQERVNLSLQGSQRKEKNIKKEVVLIVNDFIPNYTVYLLEETVLIEEKISAALTRAKPRDFFDIYYLLRGGYIPAGLKGKLLPIPELLEKKQINFQKELAHLLPYSMRGLVKEFPNRFLKKLKNLVNLRHVSRLKHLMPQTLQAFHASQASSDSKNGHFLPKSANLLKNFSP